MFFFHFGSWTTDTIPINASIFFLVFFIITIIFYTNIVFSFFSFCYYYYYFFFFEKFRIIFYDCVCGPRAPFFALVCHQDSDELEGATSDYKSKRCARSIFNGIGQFSGGACNFFNTNSFLTLKKGQKLKKKLKIIS